MFSGGWSAREGRSSKIKFNWLLKQQISLETIDFVLLYYPLVSNLKYFHSWNESLRGINLRQDDDGEGDDDDEGKRKKNKLTDENIHHLHFSTDSPALSKKMRKDSWGRGEKGWILLRRSCYCSVAATKMTTVSPRREDVKIDCQICVFLFRE